jgi:hypothetical protein
MSSNCPIPSEGIAHLPSKYARILRFYRARKRFSGCATSGYRWFHLAPSWDNSDALPSENSWTHCFSSARSIHGCEAS